MFACVNEPVSTVRIIPAVGMGGFGHFGDSKRELYIVSSELVGICGLFVPKVVHE